MADERITDKSAPPPGKLGSLNTEERMTPKQRVLERFPKAYCKYIGLSLKFEIVSNFGGRKLSGPRLRERDAWDDAAKKLDKASNRRDDGEAK